MIVGRAPAQALDRPDEEVRQIDDVGHQVTERARAGVRARNRHEAAASGRFA
jgi:hypothetical protein